MTKYSIEQILDLVKEVTNLEKEARGKVDKIYFANKDNDITFTRDGEEITVKEKHLWDELRLRANTNALDVLSNKYPEEMDITVQYEDKQALLNQILYHEYGFHMDSVTPISLINLISAIVDLKK